MKFLARKFQRQGIRVLKNKEFTNVNDCFQNKNNEEISEAIHECHR
jgi:hypothetical protein